MGLYTSLWHALRYITLQPRFPSKQLLPYKWTSHFNIVSGSWRQVIHYGNSLSTVSVAAIVACRQSPVIFNYGSLVYHESCLSIQKKKLEKI